MSAFPTTIVTARAGDLTRSLSVARAVSRSRYEPPTAEIFKEFKSKIEGLIEKLTAECAALLAKLVALEAKHLQSTIVHTTATNGFSKLLVDQADKITLQQAKIGLLEKKLTEQAALIARLDNTLKALIIAYNEHRHDYATTDSSLHTQTGKTRAPASIVKI